ncbi:Leucine rich repeat-containing protein [Flavobacterium frigoris]|uniref:Leucine rich repeat-containing protein n=1 Tax=Flavobacterium frigoris TaxID=229204 RepID=A0A1H9FRG6_FLAFI|nr:Leucine rich repeat-containing protein [Flavobacterium frigoris]
MRLLISKKNAVKNLLLQCLIITLLFNSNSNAQNTTSLSNPETIIRLDLSNNKIDLEKVDFSKFVNLEYLSLKDDHLKELPKELFLLKKLKTLDLSGNDFKVLPKDFSRLKTLENLYLNDEENLDLPQSLNILAKLPNLKSLYLDNDRINYMPSEMLKLQNLEYLSLRQNELKEFPKNINSLSHLKHLYLNENSVPLDNVELKNINFGFEIDF